MDLSSLPAWLRDVHIGAGFVGLAVFWLPLLVRKGSRVHVVCGRIFVACALVVIATALAICTWWLIDPISYFSQHHPPSAEDAPAFAQRYRLFGALLGALAIYTLTPLILAVRIVRTRHDPDRVGGTAIRLLLWSEMGISLALIAYTLACVHREPSTILLVFLLAVGIGGAGTAWRDLRFVTRPRFHSMFWWYKHMEFILRTGIAFHTALAIFGGNRWFAALLHGPWALLPWVLPSVVGVPAAWWWIQHYRRKFHDLPPPLREP